ncbi:hypothetical protein BASA83_006424 [Batrachochytrium salamandrivorans]|nr:hypothetical protein BASA83_006424 [Batrachochytrium salamandrivorans]
MAENTPSLADAHIVRTYPNDYAPSDTESEGEAQFEVEVEDEEQNSVSTRLEQNQLYMDRQITAPSGETSAWVLEPRLGKQLKAPTNIQNVGTLDDLATLLDTPDDWEVRYNQIVDNGYIIDRMNRFRNFSDDTLESYIQSEFSALVNLVAGGLLVRICAGSETKIIVGGILARYQYDLRSKTDPHFLDTEGRNLIASEATTHHRFPPGEMWYHSSRGVQVLSAMYAFNCPTFLFTQKQWKLFVENKDRNAILTFPYNDNDDHTPHVNSSLVYPMGTTFLKAIVICLLSRRFSLEESMKTATLDESAFQINETSEKTVIKPKDFDTLEKSTIQSTRLQQAARLESGKNTPSFVSGYANGQPVYTTVRVVPQDIVAGIEDEIALQEKEEYKQQSSEITLFE